MTKNDFMIDAITTGKATTMKKAEELWKEYREEHGISNRGGFNSDLASALLEGSMTEEEYEELIEDITPNASRAYNNQFRWVWQLVQDVRNNS